MKMGFPKVEKILFERKAEEPLIYELYVNNSGPKQASKCKNLGGTRF
jgi:hypothetical protein